MKRKLFVLKQFQLKELTKYSLDLSKIVIASLVIKFFEPDSPKFRIESFISILIGISISAILLLISLKISKEVREK